MRLGIVVAWLVALCCYDIRQRRLPNWLTLAGAAVILIGAALGGRGLPALAGGLALATVYLAVHLVAPTAMGAGDVKLALGLGGLSGCFGIDVWFLAALGAPLVTAAVGLAWRVRAVPHGPSMCLATASATGLALLHS
ncbi:MULTISPECIES: prepilin peptidase [Mycobacterium]|uniref:Type IV prepilin leader peptidase n=1 Tax=Mycobacterium gordonae TaxID=1778 RepID=A0A1X1VXS8_MYCGO|nr:MULTISPECIES: A24 family peptidase [Mycobacterium]MBX9979916.1 A24 family peptidase [Mycobacterium gordonae]MCQ4365653.1 A24 family peptidase [Mycobacterium gordonae]MCV7008352.1 prepilin peptidase [Mycobacterium gordonae]ODR16273.1 type IV prepilin leader peptidase [Mycobacterium gordonae]ORV74596.1 type IV prepilin leader peptidase [Mycobacterium gordonae]